MREPPFELATVESVAYDGKYFRRQSIPSILVLINTMSKVDRQRGLSDWDMDKRPGKSVGKQRAMRTGNELQARDRDAPRNGSAAWRGDTTSAWTAAESRDADGRTVDWCAL